MAALTPTRSYANVSGRYKERTYILGAVSDGDYVQTDLDQVVEAVVVHIGDAAVAADSITVDTAATGADGTGTPLGAGSTRGKVAFQVAGTARVAQLTVKGY